MKYLTVAGAFLLIALRLQAQTWDEWFHQGEMARKYALQQLAALQEHARLIQAGYDLAHQGLNLIQEIKKQNLEMHSDHFKSFAQLSLPIKSWKGMEKILSLEQGTILSIEKIRAVIQASSAYTPKEKSYLQQVLDKLRASTKNKMEQFQALVLTGKLTLTDDERLERLEMLFEEFEKDHVFIQSITHDVQTLMHLRQWDQIQIIRSRKNLGL